jgi:hypothetical protein
MEEFKLIMERAKLLRDNPSLIPLQDKIDLVMAQYTTQESRLYWLSIELLDSFYLLRDKLDELNTQLKG